MVKCVYLRVSSTDNAKCLVNGGSNSITYTPVSSISNQTTGISVPAQRGAFKLAEPQHTKSHSVTSTVFLRESNPNSANRSAGGSLSCGQPSPSSTTEESVLSALSPTSSNNTVRTTPGRPQHQSYWLHQSELALPTDRDLVGTTNALNGGAYTPQSEIRVASVSNLDAASKSQTIGSFHTLDQNGSRYLSGSSMIFAGHHSRNDGEDYLGNFASGPSHRKIQNLHGSGAAQRRFPSDTTLNFTPRDGAQASVLDGCVYFYPNRRTSIYLEKIYSVYTSGSKPGPVTIPARSRSAQPSPGPSPMASPTSFYRASDSNLAQDYGASQMDKRSRMMKITPIHHQAMDMNYSHSRRGTSSPPGLEKQKANSFSVDGPDDENESPILPSVREIIRQVEAMTQSNAATSTTDISTLGQTGQSGIPRYQRQYQPRRTQNTNADQFARGGGILRQSAGSSQRTPSAPQLRTQYTPIQAKFNASVAAASSQTKPVAPPVPPHGTTRSKAIIGAFTRRVDPNYTDFGGGGNASKKTELLSHLPTDYQKLREAFIEQRREIQRLRKQLAEKDVLITQLQNDIRLYEPWR
ncbi:unnamed protein product [Echinostoma caproni]|uniref:SH2 domain-containing protein n=1 Tax=Echinostoma caproni TaxID=27848 RepID=A0A183A8X4_9TREM|nr:unnamed protein product [Echinostoma caproni]